MKRNIDQGQSPIKTCTIRSSSIFLHINHKLTNIISVKVEQFFYSLQLDNLLFGGNVVCVYNFILNGIFTWNYIWYSQTLSINLFLFQKIPQIRIWFTLALSFFLKSTLNWLFHEIFCSVEKSRIHSRLNW